MEKFENKDEKFPDEMMSLDERKEWYKQKILECCTKGDHLRLSNYINQDEVDAKYLYVDKWCGLQWAVVNGHSEVIKILLDKREYFKSKGIAVTEEIEKKVTEEIRDHKKNEFDKIFKKPPNSNDKGKYTPLHWAAYKGNYVVTSIILKYGFDPLEIDNVGNISLHHAAASNNIQTFKLFMGLGLDLEIKNDRGHMAKDLTANKEIKELIKNCISETHCKICNKLFDFFNKRFLCANNGEIVCKNCCVTDFYYEHVNSKDKDIMESRCKKCYNSIQEAENNLNNSIISNNLNEIHSIYNDINKNDIRISCKLSRDAKVNIERLEREKKIIEHINNLQYVEQYKTIEKSVHVLDEMIKNAIESKIELDVSVLEKCSQQKNRLLAEKELRRLLSNLSVNMSSNENLMNLEDKLFNAKFSGVEEQYINLAYKLKENIELNLQAKQLLELFIVYPIREYPHVEVVDPKNKKKPTPPPKKKKKEIPFNVPEWAKELKVLKEKMQELATYVNKSQEIGLDDDFIKSYKLQADRFKQEYEFRRNEEEILKKLEEEKKKKTKKK